MWSSIAELDEHDAHVLSHRDKHFSDVLGLVLLGTAHVDLAELGHPVDELRYLVAEQASHLFARHLRVLDGVVQQRCDERFRVELQVGEDTGNRQGMLDVRLAGQPRLAGVCTVGDVEGAADGTLILRREVVDASHEVGEGHSLYECRARAVRSNTM